MSEIFGMENFAFADVAGAFDATQTTLNLNVSDTGRFNVFPALATLHNITDFANAHEAFVAGDAEIIEIVSKAGDTFDEIKRGQDGTVGIATTPGANYRISVIATRAQWNLTCRAPADGSGPFDGILAGTPTVVADAVFRFIKDNGVDDCVGSIQGSPALGDRTKLILGDTDVPERLKLETQVGSSPAQVGRLDLSGISFLHLSSDGGLGILRAAGASNDDQAHIGKTLTVDRLTGLRETIVSIVSGVLTINTPFVRVAAEGGPGVDDLDELLVPLADVPFGSRILVILEPDTTGHNITVRDKFIAGGSANISLSDGGTFLMQAQGDKIALITDGVGPSGLDWEEVWRTPNSTNLVTVKHVLAQNADSGTFTSGAFQTRPINTLIDPDGLASLVANQLTLKRGTWEMKVYATAYQVQRHQMRLQNITAGSTLITGTSSRSGAGIFFQGTAYMADRFTLAVDSLLEIQHQCSATRAPDGFGDAADIASEVYLMATFKKII